uniref:peptide chain release factor N(5)-glutamine methyltransferase n=1 Tax=Phallusia mammillata TaxID=59560 RepID=A0A6F9DUX8_9ASCI|nr:tRNA (guanine(10)-N2)-methyltransferase homolog [Phallusia mammillata]
MLQNVSLRFLRHLAKDNLKETALSKLKHWTKQFSSNKVLEPETSAALIVAHALNKKMFVELDSHEKQQPLTHQQIKLIDNLARKRLQKIPIQYIIKEWDFSGLTLKMRPPVFIPRPETEDLVQFVSDEILTNSATSVLHLLEVGCGSGAISLAVIKSEKIKSNKTDINFTCIDCNQSAVNLTKENMMLVDVNQTKMQAIHTDIALLPTNQMFDGIVSNPPYIPSKEMGDLQAEIYQNESHLALHGGYDGLDVVRKILDASKSVLKPGGWIWLEVDDSHPKIIPNILPEQFAFVEMREDIFGNPRFVKIIKKS